MGKRRITYDFMGRKSHSRDEGMAYLKHKGKSASGAGVWVRRRRKKKAGGK